MPLRLRPGAALHPGQHFRCEPSYATGSDTAPIRKQAASGIPVDRCARQTGPQNNGPEAPELIMIWPGARFIGRCSYSVGLGAL